VYSDKACRGDTSTDNNPAYYTVSTSPQDALACRQQCVAPQCAAVAYTEGRCELWARAVFAVADSPGTTCYVRVGTSLFCFYV
jgi:hypothetical protein